MPELNEQGQCCDDIAGGETYEIWGACFEAVQAMDAMPSAAVARRQPNPQPGIRVLQLELLVNSLTAQVQRLSRRVEELEGVPRVSVVPINTLAPKPFELFKTILVTVEPVKADSGDDDEYIATFPDAAISMTGNTIEDAVCSLRDRMVSQYKILSKMSPERLGRIPAQQLATLQAVMRRIE